MILNRFTTFIIIEMFPSPFVFDCRVYIMASTTWLFQVIKQHPLVHALLCFNATMPHYIPQPTVYPRRFWVYMTSYESRIGFDSNRDPKSPNLILRYRRTPTSTFGGGSLHTHWAIDAWLQEGLLARKEALCLLPFRLYAFMLSSFFGGKPLLKE